MNRELGCDGGEETGLCGEVVSVQSPRDLQLANGETNASRYASIAGGTEGEDWRGANGREESSSLSSEEDEEEGGEVRTDSGYMLLPQDPEVMNGDEVDEDDGVVTGRTWGEDSSNPCEPVELQSLGDGSEPGLGGSPRLTRWMERQVRDLAVSDDKQGSSESPREERGGGKDGRRSGCESESWARFSEVAPSTDSEDWPQTTRAGSAEATGTVEPSTSMEKEKAAAIKQAMVGFSLPSSVTPSWAHTVPESVWKAELIGGLKQKKSRRKKK
ncbi:hypothetical protein GBAR_LOCUS28425 [Geodia barretti]|uniref:Male-enhanced antigen 1 n=2 Tax=Geodia barretti TaxID=519541 RepID=A0AA35TPC2_GEOBA|nr:hypothetical protein GBAR_LOCUS28425 [Geodia barretti]